MIKTKVKINNQAKKALKKLPAYIVRKFELWVDSVEDKGIKEIMKIKGYHDEPLKGNRQGQRSIRLSKSYRAIYIDLGDNKYEIIEVIEVNKHDY